MTWIHEAAAAFALGLLVLGCGSSSKDDPGQVLDAESTLLANKDDQHSINVFEPSIKGETDRFAYRFVKP
jgi:hypothetical protein